MPTYIARRPQNFQGVALTTGDEVPERVLTNTEPESWVASGHLLKLDGNQARSLKAARDKRDAARAKYDKAQAEFYETQAAYHEKFMEVETTVGTP